MVERSPAATRRLASRARRRVQGAPTAPDPDLARQRAVADASSPPSEAEPTRSRIVLPRMGGPPALAPTGSSGHQRRSGRAGDRKRGIASV